jgi:RNA-directed DNA polymerase
VSRLVALKSTSSLKDLAPLLGMPASALAFTLYKIPLQQKYTTFSIPKKGGGTRTIKAPTEWLKKLQRALADLLTDCRNDLEGKAPKKIVSHGFRSDASISTNARQHRKRKYVLNLDLENFFPTFNFGRVRGYFIKNNSFALNDKVGTVIAQIACDGAALPQGSPCSPIVSDLLAHLLDVRMLQLARKLKCTYSRYADDITFSTNRPDFPLGLAYQLEANSSAWILGDELLSEISRAGFSVNHKKTRMQYRGSRQVVTGLTVNEKINIRADYYRSTRLMCSGLFATGSFHRHGALPDAAGKLPKGTLPQLEGILSHIHQIKTLEKIRAPQTVHPSSTRQGIERLYDRFLFFRRFVVLNKPLVICEGKTDSIYLDAAVRHLPYAGTLFNVDADKKISAIQYFRYSKTSRDVMGLGGGASNFGQLICRYKEMVDHFKYAPLAHPVILLVDNDDGPKGKKGVFGAMKHVTITTKTTAPFYQLVRNLYLVKTPESVANANGHSMIEDFFKPATRAIQVNGKTFNSSNNINTSTEYGKAVFAERVVAPKANSIDFSDFAPLLDRIVATIVHHATLVAAGAV